MKRILTSLLAAATISAGVAVAVPHAAEAGTRPAFKAPFTCGQTWRGSAWTSFNGKTHSPLKSVDWNWGSGDEDNGKAVRASAGGTVEVAGNVGPGYGHMVLIKHGSSGWKTRYAHLKVDSITVTKGQQVSQGQLIGRVGKSGGQDSSHLHYEQIEGSTVKDAIVQGVYFHPDDVHFIKSTNNC